MKMRVAEARDEPGNVRVLVLRHPLRDELREPEPGAHVDVRLPDGRIRQYSLCGDPLDRTCYRIAVRRDDSGRGGSVWIHENLRQGMEAHVSEPRNHFRLDLVADELILIGGGIGITPFIPMARSLRRNGRRFVLHYCARSELEAPLLGELREVCGDRLHVWFSREVAGRRFDPAGVLPQSGSSAHLYCCGPTSLVNAVLEATREWPEGHVHLERFAPLDSTGFVAEAFQMRIASSGRTIDVPADRSALDMLRENGYPLASSCEAGVCGTCECGYREGVPVHRDAILDPSARKHRWMPCVSRARGRIVLDI